MAVSFAYGGPTALLRSDIGLEKRQLFLKSYQFSRKQSVSQRIIKALLRAKRVIWVRLWSARKLRKVVWLSLKNRIFFTASGRRRKIRRRCFLSLRNVFAGKVGH
ncbi:hypothetical protein STAS_05123 [Striga asiatica]|uniref:Uncharacterized protein n=1 Tax=Striga asiatica TaxID=4170 RepID=A0A5A7P9R3_STRAF|nr:hypothetical protein STAS_05123 [Striga asiatica]